MLVPSGGIRMNTIRDLSWQDLFNWGAAVPTTLATGRVKKSETATISMKTKSTVNSAGVYTKPALRKRLFEKIKAGTKGGNAGQWSARKAQFLATEYKKAGGGYK